MNLGDLVRSKLLPIEVSNKTLVSSRTLTIFSATIFVISWTGTPLMKLPFLSMLESSSELKIKIIVSLVLLFMILAHNINFFTDKTKVDVSVFNAFESSVDDHLNPELDMMDGFDEIRNKLNNRLEILNIVSGTVMHGLLPNLFSILAFICIFWS